MYQHFTSQRGFTLIELSIVLVIIGLIVGGVLVGQDLIRAAQARAVITDVEKFKTAANTFHGKYDCIPGDCASATTLLGGTDLTGNPVSNGNGVIDYSPTEVLAFRQHLSIARLIPGAYSGQGGPAGPWSHVIGVNAPGGGLSPTLTYSAFAQPSGGGVSGSGCYMDGYYGNSLLAGASTVPVTDEFPYYPAFTPLMASQIDKKIDDGAPGTGTVLAAMKTSCWLSQQCVTTASEATAQYNISLGGPQCALFFVNAF